MLDAARTHLKDELPSLEQALEAYRRSLLVNTYETRYVESRLDVDVSEEEIEAYHAQHPELFSLHDHAVRALFLHMPDPKASVEAAGGKWAKKDERAWGKAQSQVKDWLMAADSSSIPALERWCIEQGAVHHLDHETWWSMGELVDEVPFPCIGWRTKSSAPPPFLHRQRPSAFRALPRARAEGEDRAVGSRARPNRRARPSIAAAKAARSLARHPVPAGLGERFAAP